MERTIAKVGYAPIETGSASKETYGSVTWLESELSGGREYSAEPTGEALEVYADGIVVYSSEENTGYTVKLTLLALIDKVEKDWLGFVVDNTKKSVAEYANGGERPRFALLVSVADDKWKESVVTYYNCQVSKRPSHTVKSSEGKLDPQFAEFEITARPRKSDHLVRYKLPVDTLPTTVPIPLQAPAPGEV